MNSPFIYSQSVGYRGHLIIPFQRSRVMGHSIYSYGLLSELRHHGRLHGKINPSKLHSSSISGIIDIASEHLDEADIEQDSGLNIFGRRYIYRNNLIVVSETCNKFFYDHYPPLELRNVAAPKLFNSEHECLSWIKIGLDHRAKHLH